MRKCGPGLPDADPEDVLLLEDLLGIADPEVALPKIDPDARRRRLTAMVNTASLARNTPVVYVIEDAHWIDEVSESMLADFLTVIPQTPFPGPDHLPARIQRRAKPGAGAAEHRLGPLTDPETAALVTELLGAGPLSRRAWPDGSPKGPQETRFSPRRWCVTWLSAVCFAGIAVLFASTRRCGEHQRARHVAGDHRRSHRPPRPGGQVHLERCGGHRLAVQPRTAGNAGY